MSRITLTCFALLLLLFLGTSSENYAAQSKLNTFDAPTGTFQKMIVENGSVTMNLDLNRFNAISSVPARVTTLGFAAAANSFFTILVFNDLLRSPEPGSMALVPESEAAPTLPAALAASIKQLVIEKLPADAAFDLAVRDGKTGFTFFNIEGHQYDYDPNAQSLSITGGNLLVSQEFANALGQPSDASATVGKISIGTTMQPIEIRKILNGEIQSVIMPPLRGLPRRSEAQVDHPVIPQDFYRMSGGINNSDRFEQIGQSWLKHAFAALEGNDCNFGCHTSGCTTGSNLCSGCSDPYGSSLNASQTGIGSRAWVNPFTGSFPSGANNHNGHNHTGTSHRITVATSDLDPSLNPNATYFAEAQYVTPHEYTWCQTHPTECNMFNNVSYRQFGVNGGPTNFTFSPVGSTVQMQPAIMAWTGATISQAEPDPGNDGIWFMGYKVTNPSAGVWHYEYTLYNENLDRAIQSFSVPLIPGVNISNIGFHAPPQEPGWANDGTQNNLGYSSTPWSVTQASGSITWNTETFAQNQNANAIRWGTLYNFRFDADQPPQAANATVGFFKTGSPTMVAIQAPAGGATPTPTPTATPGPILLRGQGKKVGGIDTARLKWRGANSANVDVYRDGNVIATTPNDGLYDDSTGITGQASFMYQVCEAGTQTCSNTVTVNFGP